MYYQPFFLISKVVNMKNLKVSDIYMFFPFAFTLDDVVSSNVFQYANMMMQTWNTSP